MRFIGPSVLVAVLAAGCWVLPPGDSAMDIDVWNRTSRPVIFRADSLTQGCFIVESGQLATVMRELGYVELRVSFNEAGGEPIAERVLVDQLSTLFVIEPDLEISQHALQYKQGTGGLVYDIPEVPELDGSHIPPGARGDSDCRELAPRPTP